MKNTGIPVKGFKIKDGKLGKSTKGMSVSKRIAQRKSIKAKPVRRTAG